MINTNNSICIVKGGSRNEGRFSRSFATQTKYNAWIRKYIIDNPIIFMKISETSGMFTSTERMFEYYFCLSKLDLSEFEMCNVTNMNSMFSDTSLRELDVSSFDTSSVHSMVAVFARSVLLHELDLSNWDTSSCINMTNMFLNCPQLASINLLGFNTSNVITMSSMFENCMVVKTLDLSSFNFDKIENHDNMFRNCYSLETVYCKNEDDCNFLKESRGCPSGIKFVVKE